MILPLKSLRLVCSSGWILLFEFESARRRLSQFIATLVCHSSGRPSSSFEAPTLRAGLFCCCHCNLLLVLVSPPASRLQTNLTQRSSSSLTWMRPVCRRGRGRRASRRNTLTDRETNNWASRRASRPAPPLT